MFGIRIQRFVVPRTCHRWLRSRKESRVAPLEARFFNETKAVNRIDHPGIVQCHDFDISRMVRLHRDGIPGGDAESTQSADA